jgi:hypothetical protein|tara:strand:+ start:286 stop:534 length:249 start_codon:yes stop_codon:yes gene_type:complete
VKILTLNCYSLHGRAFAADIGDPSTFEVLIFNLEAKILEHPRFSCSLPQEFSTYVAARLCNSLLACCQFGKHASSTFNFIIN